MNFSELVEIHHKEIEEKTIIWYPEIEDLCYRPYPDHPKGCPNIEKCAHMNIPNFGVLTSHLEYDYYFYLVYAKFDFKRYKESRKEEHLNWTERQVECLLYWQNSVKSLLSKYLDSIDLKGAYVLGCGSGMKLEHQDRVGSMENSCINVFSTMKLNGIKMEVKPKKVIYLVCLVMSRYEILFIKKQKSLEVFF
ncbi:MAG: hypothetical protein ACFFCI_17850 [Promethearchaeota archaeon]